MDGNKMFRERKKVITTKVFPGFRVSGLNNAQIQRVTEELNNI